MEDAGILQDDALHEKFCMEKLEQALTELPEDFREVIILRDLQQLSYDEISDITDIPMGTVKSRINRARAQIQVLIKDYVQLGTNS